MNAAQLLDRVRSCGADLTIDGDQLRCRVPKGSLPRDLREALAASKPEIIRLLERERRLASDLQRSTPALFARQVEQTPAATAVVFADRCLSYAELDAAANRLAHDLLALGVVRGAPVALCLNRSVEMIVSILAIHKVGGAYVPLDLDYPDSRLRFMLADAQSPVIITERRHASRVAEFSEPRILLDDDAERIASRPSTNPNVAVDVGDIAYILYTSGSSGTPKGVAVPHRGITRLVLQPNYIELDPGDRIAQASNAAFDAATFEIWGALLNGSTLVGIPRSVLLSPAELERTIREQGVTAMFVTTALFNQLAASGEQTFASLKTVLFGGEAVDPRWVRHVLQHGPPQNLVHVYGPTENTTFTTYCRVRDVEPDARTVPIGRAISGTEVHILDRYLNPVPAGIPGELYTGGRGLAEEYWHRPDLSAERFVPNPYASEPGSRMYRTGDLCRRNADGEIEFIARIDQQVKIRGFRIELPEIEATLAAHPAVRESVVVALSDGDEGTRLAAYVVPSGAHVDDETPAEPDATPDRVTQWQHVYDEVIYSAVGPEDFGDPTFNITGWKSSYDGAPIPAAAMREQVEQSVARILEHRPRRVWEIGCGTGLLLFRIAPHCTEYVGTDFSMKALDYVGRIVAERGLRNVSLRRQRADDPQGIPQRHFDAVVLNSIIQYFPSIDYLVNVLSVAVEALRDGGILYAGDVRNYTWLKALHAGIQLHRAADAVQRRELAQRVDQQMQLEEELLVAPAFFQALRAAVPRIGDVEIQLKEGRDQNELTQFRYDAVLRTSSPADLPEPAETIAWTAESSLDQVRTRLKRDRNRVVITGVPNRRLDAAVRQLAWLEGNDPEESVSDLRRALATEPPNGFDPQDFWALAHECGCRGAVSPESEGGRFRCEFFHPVDPDGCRLAGDPPLDLSTDWSSYANRPRVRDWSHTMAPKLKRFLRDRLPEYMVPSDFVLLEALPLTPNGKVDRKALSAPERSRRDIAGYVAPRDTVELALTRLWEEVLGVSPIGIRDNFFDLGGHSMLGVRLLSRIRQTFRRPIPVASLFEEATIERLAELLRRPANLDEWSCIVPIQPRGHRRPLFLVHAGGGTVFCYTDLAHRLGIDLPVYGIQARGVDGEQPPDSSLEEMARFYVSQMRGVQPEGPYYLGGWSLGAALAYEMAQQLRNGGVDVALLAMIDGIPVRPDRNAFTQLPANQPIDDAFILGFALGEELGISIDELRAMPDDERLAVFLEKSQTAGLIPATVDVSQLRHWIPVYRANYKAYVQYRVKPYSGLIVHFHAESAEEHFHSHVEPWLSELAAGPLVCHAVPGDHATLAMDPHVRVLADKLATCIEQAGARTEPALRQPGA